MDFDIFGDNTQDGLTPVLELINEAIQRGHMNAEEGIGILADMVRPGQSENSHDVRPMFVGALAAFGYLHLCDNFGELYLNSMPWGVGFQVSIRPGFVFKDQPPEAQHAMIEALAVVLRLGGLQADVTDDHYIRLHHPDTGHEQEMVVEDIVGQFRHQMDEELGPDAPEDPTRKWMP